MNFPTTRLSRLRANPALRRLVRQTTLDVSNLIMPLFIHHGNNIKNPIPSMPNQFQWSVDRVTEFARQIYDLGIPAVLLFGIPARKDPIGSDTWDDQQGIIQNALRALKSAVPDLLCITDVCLCEYTDHGHCGLLTERQGSQIIDHDATCEKLALQAISHARAGADILAPSGMIDGAVASIRAALDENEFKHIPIMSYAAKYASAFYGPFREAAQGAPQFGDRKTYQIDPANSDQALQEVKLDIDEGADIIIVKPALSYADIVHRVKTTFNVPVAAYNVSGEYAMIKAAAEKGSLDEKAATIESLISLRRAGADILITYSAPDIAQWLK
ncbi:MAG: porphobilinogen synthase [Sedimentisphaerales bacterium]|nr:porphobilinogen synthase [Sedimentisphaerales bacterium]